MEKENLPKWEDITRDELGELYANAISKQSIADIYNIEKKEVEKKLKKFGLTWRYCLVKYKYTKRLEEEPITDLLDKDNIGRFSKVLTKYLYRNGPVEDLHCDYHIPQEKMKEINIFTANRIAGILDIIMDKDFQKLLLFLVDYAVEDYWEEPVPDREYIDLHYENYQRRIIKCLK